VDVAGPGGQVREQVELDRREVGGFAAARHPPLRGVDLQVPEADGRCRCAGGPVDPPEQRVHPRRQLPRRERLGHVVVGAHGRPHEQVVLGVAGSILAIIGTA